MKSTEAELQGWKKGKEIKFLDNQKDDQSVPKKFKLVIQLMIQLNNIVSG